MTVLALACKDIRLLVRDRIGLFFIVGFPVLMGIGFGLISGSFAPGSTESNKMLLGIVDRDHSEISGWFKEELKKTGSIELRSVEAEEAPEMVRKGKLAGFLAIPPGFGETAGLVWRKSPPIQLGVDPSRAAEGAILEGAIMQAAGALAFHRFQDASGMRKFVQEAVADQQIDESLSPVRRLLFTTAMTQLDTFLGSLDQFYESDGANGAENDNSGGASTNSDPNFELVSIEHVDVRREPSEQAKLFRKMRSKWDISFPSAMMWGVMACVAGFAVTLVKERTEGTMLRLKTAPITRAQILGGKALGCFISVLGVIVMMVSLGLLLGMQIADPAMLCLATLSIAVAFVGLMMLLSQIGKTEQAVGGAAWAIIITMCMFGGGMMPLMFMPKFMTTISHFSPVKWGILSLEGAIWRGFSFGEMILPCGILVSLGVVGFVAGTYLLSRQDA